jgi:hypothetical protein
MRNPSKAALSKDSADLDFLPESLIGRCRRLIQSYHRIHGYSCLPNVLWRSHLGPFIERHGQLGDLLRRASRTRSAKKSNENFLTIAATILSLEILASSYAGWSALYPEAGEKARNLLRRNGLSPKTPLIEFYVDTPKYDSLAAIATLTPPPKQKL